MEQNALMQMKYERIEAINSYIPGLLQSLNQIEPELLKYDVLNLTYITGTNISKLVVGQQIDDLTYSFRDSLLEFTGKHKITIIDNGLHPIVIYFNSLVELKEIKNIQFQNVLELIKKEGELIKSKDLPKIKELAFVSQAGSMSTYGTIKREKHRTFGVQPLVGAMHFDGNIGVGLGGQFSLLSNLEGNDGVSYLYRKQSLAYRQYIFTPLEDSSYNAYMSLGYENLLNLGANRINAIDMVGFGFGFFSSFGERPEQYMQGGYLSIIAEMRKIYLSYDLNYSQNTAVRYGLSIAYKL
jgi:hypothetical protein